MKTIWNKINNLNVGRVQKIRFYLGISIIASALAGAFVWALLGRIMLPDTVYLLCFMGYAAVFVGFFGGVLYLYNHEFA